MGWSMHSGKIPTANTAPCSGRAVGIPGRDMSVMIKPRMVIMVTAQEGMLEAANDWDKARLEAVAAPHAGAWLHAAPNGAFDLNLTGAEVQYGVGRRLGVELCEEGPCPFCLGLMDRFGAHAET